MSLFLNLEKKNVAAQYKLPADIKYCARCTVSNQRPRIVFDEMGVCSACNYAVYKREKVDWTQREKELQDLCDRYRKTDGSFDVIVPCSGGKDGSFVAHQLKVKYNMKTRSYYGRKHCNTFIPLSLMAGPQNPFEGQ